MRCPFKTDNYGIAQQCDGPHCAFFTTGCLIQLALEKYIESQNNKKEE